MRSASTPQKTSNALLPQAKTSLLLILSNRVWYKSISESIRRL